MQVLNSLYRKLFSVNWFCNINVLHLHPTPNDIFLDQADQLFHNKMKVLFLAWALVFVIKCSCKPNSLNWNTMISAMLCWYRIKQKQTRAKTPIRVNIYICSHLYHPHHHQSSFPCLLSSLFIEQFREPYWSAWMWLFKI